MRLNVMLEPQEGMTYDEILAVAQRAQALGFEGLYRSDHYLSVKGLKGLGSTDAWATLAGLARETQDIVIGTMVSPVTFRPAGNLAKVAATVAEMAGTAPDGSARLHVGMGTGWLEEEHRQHGFPFEGLGARFRRLDEQLQVVRGLWDHDRDTFSFDGEFERLADARFHPKPDPLPRMIVGGRGLEKTPTLAVRYADEMNTAYPTTEDARRRRVALDQACEAAGRDPATVTFSAMTGCLVGTDTADLHRRARRLQERSGAGGSVEEYLEGLGAAWVAGTPEQAAERLAALAEAGVERVMLQHLLFDDLDMLDVVAQEVRPLL